METVSKTISEVAKQYDLTFRALRFWEQRGLIKPAREKGQRLYSEEDEAIIKLILAWSTAGFELREISKMLDLVYNGEFGRLDAHVVERLPDLERQAGRRLMAIENLKRMHVNF